MWTVFGDWIYLTTIVRNFSCGFGDGWVLVGSVGWDETIMRSNAQW